VKAVDIRAEEGSGRRMLIKAAREGGLRTRDKGPAEDTRAELRVRVEAIRGIIRVREVTRERRVQAGTKAAAVIRAADPADIKAEGRLSARKADRAGPAAPDLVRAGLLRLLTGKDLSSALSKLKRITSAGTKSRKSARSSSSRRKTKPSAWRIRCQRASI
jgi:hypothetical protein